MVADIHINSDLRLVDKFHLKGQDHEVFDLRFVHESSSPGLLSNFFSKILAHICSLKGPKHEKFVAGIFTQTRPVWIGKLETRSKINDGGLIFLFLSAIFLAMSATAPKKVSLFSYIEKKLF